MVGVCVSIVNPDGMFMLQAATPCFTWQILAGHDIPLSNIDNTDVQ